MNKLNPLQLEAYKVHLLCEGKLRPSTVNNRLTALSAFARFLLELNLLAFNPLELVSRLNKDGSSKVKSRADWEKIQGFRREINQDVLDLRGRLIVELLYTGIRVGELLSLELDGGEVIQVGKRRIILHPEARLAVSQAKMLHSILIEHSVIDKGNGLRWFLKTGTVYAVLRRISKRVNLRISVRNLRLAQFEPVRGTAELNRAA